ncbi:MAG TPA: helicase-associated domain-containing protein, partial [Chloroflexota bacterium]
ARLGRLPALARPLEREPPLAPEAGGLDLLQGLLVLVHEAQTRTIATRPDRETLPAERSTAPAYWSVLVPQQASAAKPGFATPYRQARLTPVPPMLERGEQQSLAQRMGRGNGFVTLAMHVALTLQILEATGELHAEPERLLNLCSLSPVVRRQVYVACLAAPHFLGELRRLLSEGGPLELHCHLGYFGQNTPLLNQAAQLRMLLLRAVDRLPRDVWYDYRSFRESLRHWAPFQSPGLSFAQVGRADRPTWWISDHQHPDQPLDLKTPTGWQQLYGRFVDDVFSGVLSWVGMIDLVVNADGPQAFRVRSLNVETADGRLHLGDDLTIQVPAGLTDSSAYSLLERGAELIHVSREGLRYRLTAERVRDLFAQGVDGPLLVRLLEGNARRSLPAILQSTLERWWTGYGQVRLYDDLTLIELADDYLLPELLRTTSLSSAIIYTFSPRLIAVEPAAVERLSGEMARAGHPPSIAEGR